MSPIINHYGYLYYLSTNKRTQDN